MNDTNEMVKVNTQESINQVLENESSYAPQVDIYETENEYVLIANMPGVKKDDVILKFEEGSLLILGRINYKDMMDRKYILNESELGNYFRKFRISDSVDESKIEAKFENGQLIVNLPKHERIKPKTIQIR